MENRESTAHSIYKRLLGVRRRHDGLVKASHVLFSLLLAIPAASGQDTNLLLMLEPVPPFPELRATATADGIPLDGLAPAASTNTLSPGDSLTALITLHQERKPLEGMACLFPSGPRHQCSAGEAAEARGQV